MIVDQYGKSFKPNPQAELLRETGQWQLAEINRHADLFQVEQLRRSCGVEPGTITFRRHTPY
jgi:hypothetical protein